MPQGLVRYHESGQSHFITFSCHRRKARFSNERLYDLFPACLQAMRLQFKMRIYGYVVMPEHIHLLVSEPEQGTLADAMHYLKLSFSKRTKSLTDVPHEPFWQKRYYDRNVRTVREFGVKLRYLHRNPVKRRLVKEPGDWKWSSFRHYAFREMGVVEIESEWTARDRELQMTGAPPRIFLSPT
jgi:putative transposase